MIKILNNKIYFRIDNELELMLLPLILERFDRIEMKIVRNIYSKKDGKFLDRVETNAKIVVEKVNLEKMRVIGKIEEVANDRVQKGFHGEDLKIGKEMIIEKKNLKEEVKLILEKINSFEFSKTFNLNRVLSENSSKFVTDLKKIDESIEYGIIEKLIVCREEFFNNLERVLKALKKGAKIVIVDNEEFCKNIRIASILRFEY